MSTNTKPRVLIVYYTFTRQTGMVVDAMADALTERGCDVTKALLEFTDPDHGKPFSALPMRWPIWHITGMLVPQRRRKTGEIGIPPEAQQGDYDLVVFGSPTWWLTTCMPVRSYLESPAAKAVLDGKPFAGAPSPAATTRATSATSRSWARRPAARGWVRRTSSRRATRSSRWRPGSSS